MENLSKTFKITIEYDGSFYYGWQRQKKLRTIQGTIEKALMKMIGHRVNIIGSGRTDAGVHALGQVASFKINKSLSSRVLFKGLNSLTPDDILIKSCERIHDEFHAQFDAKFKLYQYHIINDCLPSVMHRNFTWHIKPKLNINSLIIATSYFLGIKDFKTFEASGSPRIHTTRTITKSFIEQKDNLIIYTIKGNGFLRFMVRNIVGLLVDVGLGKIKAETVPELINSKNRQNIGITAPPQGLFLNNVEY